MKRNVENLTFLVFAFGLGMLALVGFVSYTANTTLIHDTQWVSQTHDVLRGSERIVGELDRAESSARGFVLRGEPRYISQFDTTVQALDQSLAELDQLTPGNTLQHDRIIDLRVLIKARVEMLRNGIEFRKKNSLQATLDATQAIPGFETTSQIHQLIRDFQTEEQQLLLYRQTRAANISFWTRLVIFLGTGMAVLMIAAATIVIRRENESRKRARQRVAVQYATTRLLAESSSLSQASKRLLPELALNLEFDVAELWIMDYESGSLRCTDFWLGNKIPSSYADVLRTSKMSIGEGMPGRVYANQEPIWIDDLQQGSDPVRTEASRIANLRSAIAVPVLIWPDVAGVLILLTRRQTQIDRELFQTLAAVGAQVGQFITRRKALEKLQETTELQRAILQSANFSIIATDAHGVIKSMNAASESWLGYRQDELIGKATPVMLHDWKELVVRAENLSAETNAKIDPGLDALFHRARRGEADEADWTYVRADGSSFPIHLSLSALRASSGDVSGFVAIAQDITERRAVDRMKNEFVSVVSHELRTPLTSIRGSLGLLAAGMLGNVADKAQRMLQIAINNTDRLVRLINDILDIERLESGKIALDRQSVDGALLLQQAVDTMRGMSDKNNVHLEVKSTAGEVYGDPDRILQTLTNLISNAIKFSPAGGSVEVSTSSDRTHMQFSVADHGRGIPEDKVGVIFERFQQVDASDSREKGGTGLGLAICRTIIQQHGGRIWVESELGKGSSFHFTIPLMEPAKAPDVAPERPKKVLVCDDDPWLLSIVSKLLTENGFFPVLAASAGEMLQKAKVEKPDLILLDLVMPGISGWDGLRELRADSAIANTPVIILSGLNKTDANLVEADHIDGWVQKPFDSGQLCNAIRAITNRERRLVLLVEDDADLAGVISSSLELHGVELVSATGVSQAKSAVSKRDPDLVILDMVLANGDGFEVVNFLRQHDTLRNVPLVVYSATEVEKEDQERLRLGQTEFLTKGRVTPNELETLVIQLLRMESERKVRDDKASVARR
jgi:signal transduction histidine kinase/DNA-binding response OmpR family regulator/CHASE3 domain sensor protein